MNKQQKPRGAVAVFVAACLLVLFGFLGLAVDVGYSHVQKTRLQNLADAAALACVIDPDACGDGGENPFPQLNPLGMDVAVVHPFTCPEAQVQRDCARATAESQWTPFFMRVLGQTQAGAQAVAVAGRRALLPSCITTLNDFNLNGNNIVTLNNCSADVGGRLRAVGGSGIQTQGSSVAAITVYNGGDADNCPNCTPLPTSVGGPLPSLPTVAFPSLPSLSPAQVAVCATTGVCPQGRYSSFVTFSAPLTTLQGEYVFEEGLSTGGQIVQSAGDGVTLYVPGDKPLTLSGTITLSGITPSGCAPGSGVVISHPLTGSSGGATKGGGSKGGGSASTSLTISPTDALNLSGIVDLSAKDLIFNGSPSTLRLSGSLVVKSLEANGNMFPEISANPCNNLYQPGKVSLVR